MTGRHAAPRRYPSRLWLAELASAGVLGSASLGMLAAPDATAAPTAPRETPEPTAAASYGPLELPTIGVVAPEPTTVRPAPSFVSDETPSHAQPTSVHPPVTVRPPTVTTEASRAIAAATTTPAASETTQAATTTPPDETASATTTEAATTTPTTETTATTATAETSATTPTDPVRDLIDEVLEEGP